MDEKLISSLLFFPDRIPADMPPPPWADGAEEVWLDSGGEARIHGLWWGEPGSDRAMVYFHGNAQDVYAWSPVHGELAALELPMLLIDYRGYGKSEGKPDEKGIYRDGEAALDWLFDRGFTEKDIIVFGKSLGGAVACEVARGRDLAGLVLESTFTSLASVAHRLFPFIRDHDPPVSAYNSESKLPEIKCPVLVIHGDLDALIPVREGTRLFRSAGEPKELYIVEGAGHNDVTLVAGEEYDRRIRGWLDSTQSGV